MAAEHTSRSFGEEFSEGACDNLGKGKSNSEVVRLRLAERMPTKSAMTSVFADARK